MLEYWHKLLADFGLNLVDYVKVNNFLQGWNIGYKMINCAHILSGTLY